MKKLFNDGWKFGEFDLNTSFDHMNFAALTPVDIPHDYMIYHTSDLYKNSIGFYKKSFSLDVIPSHTYIVRFEGVYMDTRVYLNSKLIFEWKYGYSTFDVDLTPYLVSGNNEICVSCTYQSPNSRWYSGAGIYRNVFFIDKPSSYIDMDGIYIHTSREQDDFLLSIDTSLVSKVSTNALLKHSVYDNGELVTEQSFDVDLGQRKTFTHEMKVTNPKLWDILSPNLYELKSELFVNNELIDSVTNPLGFRTIHFDPNEGFTLNGRYVKINGACMHHDLGALGSAMNKVALRRQFEKLLKMGVNSIRTSHNMPAKEVMELADEMGILIYTESFDMWELPKTEHDYGVFFKEWWDKDVTSWVKRDINHPSLIIWGIGNEIYDTHAGNGLYWTEKLRDKVREIDYKHNAYIGIGSNYIEWENAQKCSDLLELSGYNYGERLYDEHHEKYPNWCIFGSETSSTVQSRGIYHFPFETNLLTHDDGQCSCLGNCTTNWGAKNVDVVVTAHRDRDYVFGQYIWTGWDYIGEPTPYFSKNSYFGQIDTAGFEKDTYYHYQAEWTDYKTNPMVHLLPYWDFNEGQIIDVIAYSNAPYVELFLNYESLGKQFIDHQKGLELEGHWKVPFTKGTLFVKAYDEDGNIVATDTVSSFDDPVKITLKTDKVTLKANGNDLTFIEISVVDQNDVPVANAKNRVTVNVSGAGRLVGLDNGDSTDYEEYKGTSRRLFFGKLIAIIASTGEAGDITVNVSSNGLSAASMLLTSVETDEEVSSCLLSNFDSPIMDDVPIRKIELSNHGSFELTPDNKETEVTFEVFPKNATFDKVYFKALTKDGVEANFVKITVEGNKALVSAIGDGKFDLVAFADNDKDHPEIVSTLSFAITGLGRATYNPYEFIPGCEYSRSHSDDTKLSFVGGVFMPASENAFVTFDNVDFGDLGSDEFTLPIFSFRDEVDFDIIEGSYEEGEKLGSYTYKAKSWYNHYQDNTFKLPRKVTGLTSITFVFHVDERFSVKGFSFTKPNKAYETINASKYSTIFGDSFKVNPDSITNIGNNVCIEYDYFDFSKSGIKGIKIEGKSQNTITSIHIMFMNGFEDTRQMIEIPYSPDYQEYYFDLEDVRINGKIGFMFLPGSNFDLKSFSFVKPTE